MAYFVQYMFQGVALGCIYALVALGFTLIYKASTVVNFAQGELLLTGAYIALVAVYRYHVNLLLSILIAIAATAAIGVLFERLVLRRMLGRPVFSIIMITLGLDALLLTAITVHSAETFPPQIANLATGLPAATPFDLNSTLDVAGAHFSYPDLLTIGVTAVGLVVFYLFFRYTKYGLGMRATAVDQEAALAMGINVRTVYALAWGLAAAVAAIGGVLLAMKQRTVTIDLGTIALAAFPAIILGGIDSVLGAVVGGMIIGVTQLMAAAYIDGRPDLGFLGPDFHEIAPYFVMIIILLIRPYGLFGTRKVERV
jgi:branched-chain amino acid transport system permease protein